MICYACGNIYTQTKYKKEKIKKWFCSYLGVNPYKTPPTALRLERPTARGVTGAQPPCNAPLNYFLYCVLGSWVLDLGSWNYARLIIFGSFMSVVRSMVPVCRDGIMSLSCFLMGPNTGSLILT